MFEKKHAAMLSGASGVAGLIATVALAVAWSYWSAALDACPEGGCGCVLHARLRGTTFSGGSPVWCGAVTYFSLGASVLAFVVAVYFFLKLRSNGKDYVARAHPPPSPASARLNRARSPFSPQFKILCAAFVVLTFVHACVLSEGYLSTCRQYKPVVSKHLKASGDLSDLVMDRLSCSTMYDFLDYLHPDSNYHVPHLPQYQRYGRTFRINTGFILLTSLLLSWANVVIWCVTTIFVIFQAS